MQKILHADRRRKQNQALHRESFPLEEGIGSILNQGNILSEYEVSRKVIHLLRHSQQVRREEDGVVHFLRKILRIHSHNLFIGLTIDGKHVWQQEEE